MTQSRALQILYVGPMVEGSTTAQRAQALKDLGHQLTCVSTVVGSRAVVKPSLLSRLRRRIFGLRDEPGSNRSILRAMGAGRFDLLWIDKGLTIHARTLKLARASQRDCRIVGFSPDDMLNPANQSRHFAPGLPLYDFYVSTKSFNVDELQALGCPKVLFMENAYDPHTHRPLPVGERDRLRLGGPVGFIGQWEPARAESLRGLALAGIPVRVWGYTWERMRNAPPALRLENQPCWGDEYARAICAFDINLCFLRKSNRDLQTQRTVEIPACGAFMLAERTEEHLRLFTEGREADFFSSDQELIEKTRYYLANPEERRQIALRGRQRCLRDGYSYQERLSRALDRICVES